jgi:DNA-binding transcriptional ArsR family regulator
MEYFIRQAKAISDPTRVRMLKLLEEGELCVCEIMEVLELAQSTASKHLGILKTAGLVESRKEGTWSYYRLAEKIRAHGGDFQRLLRTNLDDDELVLIDRKYLARKKRSVCRTER